jgi:hypothetical protein
MRSKLRGQRQQEALHDAARFCSVAAAMVGAAVIGGVASTSASKSASKSASAANQAALDANAYQGEIARDQWDSYKSIYQPLERTMAASAENYDTAENRELAASAAQATVSSELGKAQDRLSRTVGYDPSSAAAQAAQANLSLTGAAMGATSQNTARQKVKDTAYARQLDMLGMGKGLVANASTGMANAANVASGIAANQQNLAGQQANAAGTLVGGLAGGLAKVDWSHFGTSPGNGMTSANMYSGGNDGYTLPNGESLGT